MTNKPISVPSLITEYLMNVIKADKTSNSIPYGKVLAEILNYYLIKISVDEGAIQSKDFTSMNLKLMGLEVSTRYEQNESKKKKQKTKSMSSVSTEVDTEETIIEVIRKELRRKKRNDPIPQEKEKTTKKSSGEESELEKREEMEENDLEKDQEEEMEENQSKISNDE